jgi:hypothetical protein
MVKVTYGFLTKIGWAMFWAIISLTHLVTLFGTKQTKPLTTKIGDQSDQTFFVKKWPNVLQKSPKI